MIHGELFDPDLSHGRQDANSAAAHEALKPRKKVDREEVWKIVHRAGAKGVTLEQIAEQLGKVPSACSGRVTELLAAHMIYRKAEKGTTRSGNRCSVYIA
jgi:hypothetical protein